MTIMPAEKFIQLHTSIQEMIHATQTTQELLAKLSTIISPDDYIVDPYIVRAWASYALIQVQSINNSLALWTKPK